jgi:hypothetical protein
LVVKDQLFAEESQMIYYKYLILEILYLAAGRWGLLEPPKKRTETPASK